MFKCFSLEFWFLNFSQKLLNSLKYSKLQTKFSSVSDTRFIILGVGLIFAGIIAVLTYYVGIYPRENYKNSW